MKLVVILSLMLVSLTVFFKPNIRSDSSDTTIKKDITLFKQWTLHDISYDNINCEVYQPADMKDELTLTITPHSVSGKGPVNNFFGDVDIEANRLTISKLVQTKKFGTGSCVEKHLIDFLSSSLQFEFKQSTLVLTHLKSQTIQTLVFK
jgi:heat shock protein HslJ